MLVLRLLLLLSLLSYSFSSDGVNYSPFISLQNGRPKIGNPVGPDSIFNYPFIVIDCLSNVILMENNPHKKTYPSSMTKVMTLYLVFCAIRDGSLSEESTVLVSVDAWKMTGSKMFLKAGDKVTISDIIDGIAICSGNDAAKAASEAVSGSEEAFVAEMNYMAKLLFMNDTHFCNPSGWPDPNHYSTVYDLALLGLSIIKDFPQYYKVFSKKVMKYNGIVQYNYNKLLFRGIGVDGIKTGHTDAGGHGIIASSRNERGRRLLVVINECPKESIRNTAVQGLFRMGLQNYENYLVLKRGNSAVSIRTWLGVDDFVNAVPNKDIVISAEKRSLANISIYVEYNDPIRAPIVTGQQIASLVIVNKETNERVSYPLYAESAVAKVGIPTQVKRVISYLVLGL